MVLDTVLRMMNLCSRVVLCGLIAEYSATEPYGYKMLRSVLVNRIRMQGMIVFDWKDRYGEALKGLSGYLAEGKLKYRESIVEGIDNAPKGGITTEITGEGDSVAPTNAKLLAEDKEYYEHYGLKPDWRSLDQYFNRPEK